MRNKPFLNFFIFYFFYAWASTFARAILPTHFLNEGLKLEQMILGYAIFFLGEITLFFFIKKFYSNIFWAIAILLFILYLALLMNIVDVFQFYVANLIGGFIVFLFWIPTNIAYFEKLPKEKTGHGAAWMFSLFPIVSIVASFVAGLTGKYNMIFFWGVSIFFFLIPLFLVKYQHNFNFSYSIKDAIKEVKATRVFIFLSGVWDSILFGLIPIYTLFFIKTPFEYGSYIAYLGVMGALANIIFGRLTDRIRKRALFLYPVCFVLAMLTFIFPLGTNNLIFWIMITGVIQFFTPFFWNLTTTLVVDSNSDLRLAMTGRELILAAGRVTGLLLTFLSFTFEKTPFYLFFVLGFAMLLIPLNLLLNTRIRKTYKYL